MRVLRRYRLQVVCVTVVVLLSPVAAIGLSASLRDFIYRQLGAIVLTDRVLSGERDAQRIAETLNAYVFESARPDGGPVLDIHPWNVLLRGVGWCDQKAWLLGTLLATRDIDSRPIDIGTTKAGHVTAEVYIGNDWRAFDPLFGLVFQKGESLATIQELARRPEMAIEHPSIRNLPDETRARVEAIFLELYSNGAKSPHPWLSALDATYGSRPRLVLREALRWYARLFGDTGVNWFQDLYLALLPDRLAALDVSTSGNRPVFKSREEDPALVLYYRARNYHLFGRAGNAEPVYRAIIEEYPHSYYAEMSAYFLGQLDWKVRGRPADAIDRFSAFVARYPESPWRSRAYDAMGAIYEEMGDIPRAIAYYQLASSDEYVSARDRLARLRRSNDGA